FSLANLSLTHDGAAVALQGASLTSSDGVTWALSGLGTLGAADGTYVLTVNAAGSSIQAAAGNLLAAGASTSWVIMTVPTQLGFLVQPANTAGATAVGPAVQVAVEDQRGNVVAGDNTDQVTLAVASGPGTFTAG